MDGIRKLNVLVDTSGSMLESGKRLIARGVVRQVERYVRLGYGTATLHLFSMGESILPVAWEPSEEYPDVLLECMRVSSCCIWSVTPS